MAAQFSAASFLALSESTTRSPTFDGMEALVVMAIAVLIVVLVDGVMLAETRHYG